MSTSISSCEKEETTRGRTRVREPPNTGILLVKPLKAWNDGKVRLHLLDPVCTSDQQRKANIPVARYLEARAIPCLDGVASWIMETPPLWDADCEECRRIQRGLYTHPNGHIRTRRDRTPLPKNDDGASDEDELGTKSTSVAQPNINMIPSPALEDENNNTIPSPCDGSR
ncbi:hypothetical protein NEOLEDRAFT_196013 [Neolentinus lepideus HHB14362 ss-1]|uniref:Uncharacterized protein n=1 Tax=Neolentinus lepideus HHB14362 ss-1 TaxID=1314782 RepID=A0A165ME85_9AGAM|nr:hypothetical protein NEOLEDRAFT_196013 [Neolentinus lepideus HHB14362 ss-1]